MKDKNIIIRVDNFTKSIIKDCSIYCDKSISDFIMDCVKKEIRFLMLKDDFIEVLKEKGF